MNFNKKLLSWYTINKRELPWRCTNNPYFIWLSEIILQQTRVSQGLPYYLKFTKSFPTVSDLANASEDQILKLWQGLGYYSRARNLHFTAKNILENYDGVFPNSYNEILKLKGVGEYTAAAISSFAFNLPYAVVDGNVVRVLSRIFGINVPFENANGKKEFQSLAQNLLDVNNPAENNQAIMEFGALQCTFKAPKCQSCAFNLECIAYTTNGINKYPVKIMRQKIHKRFINYFVISGSDSIMLGKIQKGVWKGLYDFPFIENKIRKSENEIVKSKEWSQLFIKKYYKIKFVSSEFLHKLSHQHIYAKFWIIDANEVKIKNYFFIKNSEMNKYPISRLADKFLKQYNIL